MSFKDCFTFNKIVRAFKFLNVVDNRTGSLSPPKILAWAISIGICVVMFKINDEKIDLMVFAGALTTLVAAFGVTYRIGEGKKVNIKLNNEMFDITDEGEPETPKEDEVVQP